MRILVAGGTGLLGTDLCRRLSGVHSLLAWARKPPVGKGLSVACQFESLDVTDAEAVREGIGRFRPDLILHCAGMTDVDACEREPAEALRLNAEASGILAAASAEAGSAFLYVSTDYVFDGESPSPYRETDPVRPVSVYGRSKLEGERLALARAPRAIVVRVSGLFGAARQNFVGMAAQRLRAGEPVSAVTDQVNSPSYTADLADGIARLIGLLETQPLAAMAAGPLHGVFHLANRGGASRLQVAQEVAGILGKPVSLIRPTRWADLGRPARRPPQSRLDCSRFSERVGQLRPWQEAIRAFLNN